MAVQVACTSSAALIRTRLYWSEMPYVGTVNNSDLLTVSGCGRSVAVVVSVPDWLYLPFTVSGFTVAFLGRFLVRAHKCPLLSFLAVSVASGAFGAVPAFS